MRCVEMDMKNLVAIQANIFNTAAEYPIAKLQQDWERFTLMGHKRRLRIARMGDKRRLLLRLSGARFLGMSPRLNEQESELYLTLLPRWKRWLTILAWSGVNI